jgi:acetoin utilization deacetylase AcuC-like enzyme
VTGQALPTVRIFCDPMVLKHDSGNRSPESPGRILAILQAIGAVDGAAETVVQSDRAARLVDLHRCHDERYLERARNEARTGGLISMGGVPVSRGSWPAALHAAGTVLSAVDWVLAGRDRRAFCVIRPPGHHAGANYAHGFCLLNNVAIGARYAQSSGAIRCVLIVDWDAHHGNGTQDIFYTDPSVVLADVHRHPWHLNTGSVDECGVGAAAGHTINAPVGRGADGPSVLAALSAALRSAIRVREPDLLFVSCGFDPLASDAAGGLCLRPADFGSLTDAVVGVAESYCRGRIVSVLEGGYLNPELGAAAQEHVAGLNRRSSVSATQGPECRGQK